MDFAYIGTILLLAFGFGFVIFWHELGHFLAAKWAGVKVEQFAVGFGQAMFSWRKGLGIRWGSSRTEYEKKLRDYLATQEQAAELAEVRSEERRLEYAAAKLGISETEYRLNWIPLGGYVKMLGQDDLDPNSLSESPRAYNNKPIGKRMVIVSAGVVMNIILAIVFFTILFRIGFDVPPALVGSVAPGSPAQLAGIQVGDRIRYLDDTYQHDFTKISMTTALLEEGQEVDIVVEGPANTFRNLKITPKREPGDVNGFLRLGVGPAPTLQGPDPKKLPKNWDKDRDLLMPSVFTIKPGETITRIDGQDVGVQEFYKLDQAAQASFGKPLTLTLSTPEGQTRETTLQPTFADPFGTSNQLNFAGLVPRASVAMILESSSARGKLQPGDVIVAMTMQPANDRFENLSPAELRDKLLIASKGGSTVDLDVLRSGEPVAIKGLSAQVKIAGGLRGLGIGPDYDANHAVVGSVVAGSAADRAKLPKGVSIVSVDGQPVKSWYDVHRILRARGPGDVALVAKSGSAAESSYTLSLTQADVDEVALIRYSTEAMFRELSEPRETKNPIEAAAWGVAETRDLMVQFYLTIRRMIQGSVAASNAMGPIGIFHQGSKIADRGNDWLLWFLAMISANLAVVNFLPIPIVDGGLFVFLILEKIMGKPLSPRAQSIAQIVGLALIASVFLFVTYHDIARML